MWLANFYRKLQAVCQLLLLPVQCTNIFCAACVHPAADCKMPPPALFWFHPMSLPVPFTHHAFENSMIGLGMRTFNSPVGVSPDAWQLMSTCTTMCLGCRMMFSIDGFHAHTPQNRCSKPGASYSVALSYSKHYVLL
jgi:hypothetical protein